ncbi:MAG: hypothetical protein AAGI71_13380 [Bacteroidota bacterium]
MMHPPASLKLFLCSLLLAVVALGCDSGGDDDPDVSFIVSSTNVTLDDGSDGIQFFAQPNVDVILVRVDITSPTGTSLPFNAGSQTVISGQAIALQDPGFAYFRVSGPWTFTFSGRFAAGSQDSYTFTTQVNVGA